MKSKLRPLTPAPSERPALSTLSRSLAENGSALLVVLLAVALLFSLGVPFLLTSRLRSEASQEAFDQAAVQVAVQSATQASIFHQAGSHPAMDPSPRYDGPEEWDPTTLGPLPQALGEDWKNIAQSWGVEVENAQARVSLGSAPPLLLQNLLHPCYLREDVALPAEELPVTSTAGFPDQGFLRIMGYSIPTDGGFPEIFIQYTGKTANAFTGLILPGADGQELPQGLAVIDRRVYNLALARIPDGEYRPPEVLSDLLDQAVLGGDLLAEEDRRYLQDLCWFDVGTYGGDAWGPAVLIDRPIDPDRAWRAPVSDGLVASPGTILCFDVDQENPLYAMVFASNPGNRDMGRGALAKSGRLSVFTMLPNFPILETRVHPLLREPVDVNACRLEILEAMLTGLRWRTGPPIFTRQPIQGRFSSSWIHPRQARDVASAIVEQRPLQGPEDLWIRVLRPMMDDGTLSDLEAWLIYLNSLDPNHGSLAQSTVPFGYASGNRYLQRVNAAVRSPLGRTRSRASVVQDLRVAPDGPLLQLWHHQENFEDAVRYGRGAQGVTTLPRNVGSLGGQHDHPNGLSLRAGTVDTTGLQVASKETEESSVIPIPARELDNFVQGTLGRTEHFDFEASPLGYDVAERGSWQTPLFDWNIVTAASSTQGVYSSNEPLHYQAWYRLHDGLQDGFLFDLSGPEVDKERVFAAIEQGRLVIRAYDNAGQDPFDEDNLEEALEVRVDPAEYDLEDRWFHLSTLLRGISARGFQVAVDGVPRGEVLGYTELTAPLSAYAAGSPDDVLVVESTEGFPNRGVLRVGQEVIEYSSKTANTFITQRIAGPDGYLGGRAAREDSDVAVNSLDTYHPAGSGVELYGYSAIIDEDGIPIGGGRLTGNVGPWSLAQVVNGQDPIEIVSPLSGRSFQIGMGITCGYLGEIELGPIPQAEGDPYYAEAFQENGGYALMVQWVYWGRDGLRTGDNCLISGMEVVEYSSRSGTTLNLIQRNIQLPLLSGEDGPPDWAYSEARSFVTEWESFVYRDDTPLQELPDSYVYIIPISVKGSGISDVTYLPGDDNFSQFVQLTSDADAGLTEWVRYDSIINGMFVRDDWGALQNAVSAYLSEVRADVPEEPGGPGDGGNPGGGNIGSGGRPGGRAGGGLYALTPPLLQETEDAFVFARTIGEPVDDRPDTIETIRRAYGFRGVMGTYDHAQQSGTRLVPVFKTLRNLDSSTGFVGRKDRVAVMQPQGSLPPNWFTVQWAKPSRLSPRTENGRFYVAFYEDPGLPFLGWVGGQNLNAPNTDIRTMERLVKFPSGERPVRLDTLNVGGSVSGGTSFNGMVDEVSLHTVAGMGPANNALARGAWMLDQDLEATEPRSIFLHQYALVLDGRRRLSTQAGGWFANFPESGLLDIDGERIAYSGFNPGTGEIEIAPGGRGLHGTEARGHAQGAHVYVVDGRPVSVLTNNVTPGEATLIVEDGSPFPPESLLLIDQELIHTSHKGQNQELMMPRHRSLPGEEEDRGDGILRGRFGTVAADHGQGTLVYSFPCRWQDRYVAASSSPAAAWLQIGLDEPQAYWRGLQYEAELPDASHKVRLWLRSGQASFEDVPGTPGVVLLEEGKAQGGGLHPLDLASDRLDLRISFDWDVGAFDPVNFSSLGWTTAPRFRNLMIDYLAEPRIQRWAEVVE
ncbi:MAG: hypothetical protein DWQ01_15610 [Planctomycetota bacterium]|nr:MAG: hypothetical protein DWQ01_15610 [Planctomycetota bacterium]